MNVILVFMDFTGIIESTMDSCGLCEGDLNSEGMGYGLDFSELLFCSDCDGDGLIDLSSETNACFQDVPDIDNGCNWYFM